MVWYDMTLKDKDGVTKWKTTGKSKQSVVRNLTKSGKKNYKKGKLKIRRGKSPY